MNTNYSALLPLGLRGKRQITLTPGQVSIGSDSFDLAALTAARIRRIKTYTNGIPTSSNYTVQWESAHDKLKFRWGYGSIEKKAKKALCEEVFDAFVNQLHVEVGPQIAQRIVQSNPQPGAQFGPWTFHPHGVSAKHRMGTREFPWHSWAGISFHTGSIQLAYVTPEGKEKTAGALDLWSPNAIFLGAVTDAYRTHFGG